MNKRNYECTQFSFAVHVNLDCHFFVLKMTVYALLLLAFLEINEFFSSILYFCIFVQLIKENQIKRSRGHTKAKHKPRVVLKLLISSN